VEDYKISARDFLVMGTVKELLKLDYLPNYCENKSNQVFGGTVYVDSYVSSL